MTQKLLSENELLRKECNNLQSDLTAAQQRVAELEKKYKLVSEWRNRLPFCPDHRDKVAGMDCRQCTVEHLTSENARLKQRVEELERERRVYLFDADGVALGSAISVVAESVNEAYELAREWCKENNINTESVSIRMSKPFKGSMVVFGWNGDY